jgi:hypothetical protein
MYARHSSVRLLCIPAAAIISLAAACSDDDDPAPSGSPSEDAGADSAPEAEPDTPEPHDSGPPDAPTETDSAPDAEPDAPACTDATVALDCNPNEFCDQGSCEPCPSPQDPPCDNGGVVDHPYGNGCIERLCCVSGSEYDPQLGECNPIPLLDLEICPWERSYGECYVKLLAEDAGMTVMTPAGPEVGALAFHNSGLAPVQISSIKLNPGTSPDFAIVTDPLPTEVAPDETIVIQFSYTPDTTERDLGEFVLMSNAVNGNEWRIPVIGDTSLTACTEDSVKDTCIQGQFCDEWAASCTECMQPHHPLCTGGTYKAVEPDGSYLCVAFICVCPAGSVYVPGKACQPIEPCDASCTQCEQQCTMYPNYECTAATTFEHCTD